jgi:hypothetical protein
LRIIPRAVLKRLDPLIRAGAKPPARIASRFLLQPECALADPIYKVMVFLKRKSGMSLEAFRDYYESTHAKLCEKYAVGSRRYVRRYVTPLPDPVTGKTEELAFDVVTEIWIDNRVHFEKLVEAASRGEMPAEVLADEERVFDRSKSRFATVIECDSDPAVLVPPKRG